MAEATNTRKPLSKRVRFEVFKRDGFRCMYCGAHPPDVLLEADHITPVVDGGENTEDNLITACFNCNRGKGAVPLSVVPMSLADKAAETVEREAQLAGYRDAIQGRLDRIEKDAWRVAEVLMPGSTAPDGGIRRDWFTSIKTFNARLDLHEVEEAADIAFSRKPESEYDRFKYFCGVCWSKIKAAANG